MTNWQRLLKIMMRRKKSGVTIAEIKKELPANNPYDVVYQLRRHHAVEAVKVRRHKGYHFVYRLAA